MLHQAPRPALIASLCCVILGLPAAAQGQGTIPGTEPIVAGHSFTMESDILGEQRKILISLPAGYSSSEASFPVLYLLDGPSNFAHTTGTMQVLTRTGFMPQMIVVAIANTDRTRDLTPSGPNGSDPGFAPGGGAEDFLRFMTDELQPHVEATYRTLPYRILIGHSFGGLFAVYAQLRQPESFNAFVAISPSLWWNDRMLLSEVEGFFEEHQEHQGFLFATLGNEGGGMQAAMQSFDSLMQEHSPESFVWNYLPYPDDTHGSVPLRSTDAALRTLFADWSPTAAFASGDLERVKAHFASLSKKYGLDVPIPEAAINQFGYAHLTAERFDRAIEAFLFNIQLYPDSANVYDSLGEAYETAGDDTNALLQYKKAAEQGGEIGDPNTEVFERNYQRVKDRIG